MSEATINYDPRTKQYIKEKIYDTLYAPVHNYFNVWLEKIIINNTIEIKGTHKSFSFKGVDYNIDETPPPRRRNRLAPKFHSEMNAYLKEKDELERYEIPYVLGYITSVLDTSNYFGDYLKLLPEPLHTVINNFKDNCVCRNSKLTEEKVEEIKKVNSTPIELIKYRIMQNLIL